MPQDPGPDETQPSKNSDYEIRFVPSPKRVRVEFNGTWVADSSRAMVVHETRAPPMHYFPQDDVRMDFLEMTDHQTHCPFKGNASYWTLTVGGQVEENVVWSYEGPYSDGEELRGYLSFYQDKMSAIYEGDDEVPFLYKNVRSMHANSVAGWLLRRTSWSAAFASSCATAATPYLA